MRKLMVGGLLAGSMVALPALGAAASAAESTVYVSPSGSASHHDNSCADARYSSIQAAADAVAAHGQVVVCPGTYRQSVTIHKSLRLTGRPGAIIDASGQPYGVGMTASYVTVSGLQVQNANAGSNQPNDGIITAGFGPYGPSPADHETIIGNYLTNNGGSGIDLNSTSYSLARNNVSVKNGIGINVSNDLGKPASHNSILTNTASKNPGGCGIVLADHSGLGVFANQIDGNTADDNGLGTPSAPNASSGSGIILAAGPGGAVYNNLVSHNFFSGNGHGGVALHAHAPGLNFSGNQIVQNIIGTNNLRTDYKDLKSTGIYLGDASPLRITVSGNTIRNNSYGIFTAGSITLVGVGSNHYYNVGKPVATYPTYGG